jgi:hypothetical protein
LIGQENRPENLVRLRRYVLIFNCSKTEGNPYSNITIVFPSWFTIDSFPRNSWFPSFEFRILVDGKNSYNMVGEYNNGELYFDNFSDLYRRMRTFAIAGRVTLRCACDRTDCKDRLCEIEQHSLCAAGSAFPARAQLMNGPQKFAHFHGRSSCSICAAKALRSSAPTVLNPVAADARSMALISRVGADRRPLYSSMKSSTPPGKENTARASTL